MVPDSGRWGTSLVIRSGGRVVATERASLLLAPTAVRTGDLGAFEFERVSEGSGCIIGSCRS